VLVLKKEVENSSLHFCTVLWDYTVSHFRRERSSYWMQREHTRGSQKVPGNVV